jgi:hypothetical protein
MLRVIGWERLTGRKGRPVEGDGEKKGDRWEKATGEKRDRWEEETVEASDREDRRVAGRPAGSRCSRRDRR